MAKEARKRVGLNMRAELYKDLAKLAKDNGQTTTYVLEQAAEHYIRFVAPTQSVVRPEIMAHVRRSMNKNRKLLQLLAVPAEKDTGVARGARAALLKRLRSEPAVTIGRWSRDELYEDKR